MKKFLILTACVIIIAVAIIILIPQDGNNNKIQNKGSLYDQQAHKICTMLTTASNLYKAKKYEEAAKTSDSAYWDVYDNIMEIKYRSFASPGDIFEVENKFHSYTSKLRSPYTSQSMSQIIKHRDILCNEMYKEAKILNQNS